MIDGAGRPKGPSTGVVGGGRIDERRNMDGIRPLYGVAISDDLALFRRDLALVVNTIEQGLQNPNDARIDTEKERRYAQSAKQELIAALVDLGGTPPRAVQSATASSTDFPGSAGGIGTVRPLYGVFISDSVGMAQGKLRTEMAELRQAVQSGGLTPEVAEQARDALANLRQALTKLERIKLD